MSGRPIETRLVRIRHQKPRDYRTKATEHEVVVKGMSELFEKKHLGTGVGDLHIFDYSLFYFNIRHNLTQRLNQYFESKRACL